jgi:uncharacterized protein (UPF0332 family)
MITPEQRNQLIATRLEQAEECIADVELSIANGRYRNAANRVYYGMFYAMLALGLLRQFETSKHQQMIGWFNKNFVHTNIFPKQFIRLVNRAFDTRTNSDYKITLAPSADELDEMFADMKTFIYTIKEWIEANPA